MKSDLRLYREIMSAPFEGDHWGLGHDEEVSEGWTDSSDGSDTQSEDEIVTPATKVARSAAQIAREAEAARRAEEEQRILLAKLRLRELAATAYWQTGGTPVPSSDDMHGWRALSSSTSCYLTSWPLLTCQSQPSHRQGSARERSERSVPVSCNASSCSP